MSGPPGKSPDIRTGGICGSAPGHWSQQTYTEEGGELPHGVSARDRPRDLDRRLEYVKSQD